MQLLSYMEVICLGFKETACRITTSFYIITSNLWMIKCPCIMTWAGWKWSDSEKLSYFLKVTRLVNSTEPKGKHSPPNFLRQKLYFSTEYTKSATKYLVNVPVTFKSAFNMKKSWNKFLLLTISLRKFFEG